MDLYLWRWKWEVMRVVLCEPGVVGCPRKPRKRKRLVLSDGEAGLVSIGDWIEED